jgi:hypothetical protein
MSEIIQFPPLALPPHWNRLRCHVQAALTRTGDRTYTVEDVLECIQRQDAQWWPGTRCAIVTELEQTPQRLLLRYWLAGGDFVELRMWTAPIETWARQQGCDGAIIVGRAGWARALRGDWKTAYTVHAKDL